jgi:hypothetical protein
MAVRFSVIALLPTGAGELPAWLASLVPAGVEVIGLALDEGGVGLAFNGGLQRANGEFACCVLGDTAPLGVDILERLAAGVVDHGFDLMGRLGGKQLPAAPEEWVGGGAAEPTNSTPQPVVWLDPGVVFARRATLLRWRFEEGWHADDGTFTVVDLALRVLLWGCQRLGAIGLAPSPRRPVFETAAVQRSFLLRHGGCLPLASDAASRWQTNLRVLRLVAPRVAAALTAARKPGRARQLESASDPTALGSGLWEAPLTTAAAEGDAHIILGVGSGALINAALASKASRVVVLESDAHLIARLLLRETWDEPLLSRRLVFHLVPADLPSLGELAAREYVAVAVSALRQGGTVHLSSSSSAGLYPEVSQAVPAALEQAVRDAREFPPLQIAGRSTHDVTVVSPRCALFNDIACAFEAAGLRTRLLQVPDVAGEWSRGERRAALAQLRTEPGKLILLRSRALFETESPEEPPGREMFVAAPVVSWWWDVPNVATTIDLRTRLGHTYHFAFARDLLPLLPEGAQWLPPAARAQFCEAVPRNSEPEIEVSFVGQTRLNLLQKNLHELTSLLDYFADGAGRRIATDIGCQRGFVALHDYLASHTAEIDEIIQRIEIGASAAAYYMSYILAMSVTGAFRIAAIEKLRGAGVDVVVYGDDGWLRSGAADVRLFRGALPVDQLPWLYDRSRINLNLNFMQVSSTVNPKVLDIAACGGVALTDYRPELEALYPDPGARPFSFRSLDELVDRIGDLRVLDLSTHRQAVRAHTLAHHTLAHRVRWIAQQFSLMPAQS